MKNTKDELEHWDKILDEYESSVGLPNYINQSNINTELENYLSMNRDQLEKLTPEDCAQISLRLTQISFYIQRTLNREIARHNWSETTIKLTVADEVNNYKGYGYVEKFHQAVKHNERAHNLYKIQTYAKQRMDRLSYLATNIKNISDVLLSIQRNKVKHVN